MSYNRFPLARFRTAPLLLCLSLLAPHARAQSDAAGAAAPKAAQNDEEVVRVSTDLVQTDVMVFDKQGNFVDGLRPEQFELKVEGKPQSIVFFERVNAGSVNEDAQLAAARGAGGRAAGGAAALPLDRGRTVFFFVDDLHLSTGSTMRTRKALERFVEREVGQNDEAAMISASGQFGFLQQLTTEKTVLYAALKRLAPRNSGARDFDSPPMSEVQALAIDRNDQQVLNYFVDAIIREYGRMGRESAVNLVTTRATNILSQSRYHTTATLSSLESLVRRSAPLPGRKIVFFISDGFIINTRDSDVRDHLRRITDAAARSGVVVYTLDARGLTTGLPDISERTAFDPAGQLVSVNAGENTALQESLRTIAADTGGRAMLNTNAINLAVSKALKETSVYYLLAWRPEATGERGNPKFRRIEAVVKGRPDLNVVVRRGFYTVPPEPPASSRGKKEKEAAPAAPKTADGELFAALTSIYPRAALPTSLALGYLSAPERGTLLTASIEVDSEALTFSRAGEQQSATAGADLALAVYDTNGKVVHGFKQPLNITAQASQTGKRPPVGQTYQLQVKPGLYQVRAAARDRQSGRAGSAAQWIEIPELKPGEFAMSSLFVAERTGAGDPSQIKDENVLEGVTLNAGRRFARSSWLRLVTFIYNAQAGAAQPADVALQVQIFRDDQPVITTPLRKVETAGLKDVARIPYAAEIPLGSLAAGRYVLHVTAIDRAAKASTSRQVKFQVE